MPGFSRTTFGLVDGRPVFMDLGDDSYFMLEPEEETAFLASLGGKGPRQCNLLPSGNPERAEERPLGPANPPRPPLSVLTDNARHSRGALRDAVQLWRLLLAIRSALRRTPIAEVVAGCASREARRPPAAAATLAGRFARAHRLVPIPGNCLTDSLALLCWLRRHGAGATLVFGVKLDPFAAHCWLQTDDLLLNDRPARVERFTPVRAIPCSRPTL